MKLNVITHNPGKVKEYGLALSGYGLEMIHVNREYDEVQTAYLEEVVDKGIKQLSSEGLENFMVDDSGLFVDHLGGFPGVYSSYGQKTIGNAGILKLMDGVENRRAVFKCCIGARIGDQTVIVTGQCPGTILNEERGSEGFGYDPIFSPDGIHSFAEIPIEEKNVISHRGIALRMFVDELKRRKIIS